jgi:hypothetical protein
LYIGENIPKEGLFEKVETSKTCQYRMGEEVQNCKRIAALSATKSGFSF